MKKTRYDLFKILLAVQRIYNIHIYMVNNRSSNIKLRKKKKKKRGDNNNV